MSSREDIKEESMTPGEQEGADRAAVEELEPAAAQGDEPAAAGEPGPSAAELLAAREQELQEGRDRLLRLAAEFENYKKRIEREKATCLEYAEEQILRELLPTVDNLERAIAQGQGEESRIEALLEGVQLTCKGLLVTLEKFGLRPVESVGQPFDPHLHEALAMEASAEAPVNQVLKEYQKGYLFKERLIRPAKVVVSRGDA